MIIELENCDLRYDIQSICLLFFPREPFSEACGKKLRVALLEDCVTADLLLDGREYHNAEALNPEEFDSVRTVVKRTAYDVLRQATNKESAWGIVTGIRPANLYAKLQDRFGENARTVFENRYFVSPEKTDLCLSVIDGRKQAVSLLTEDSSSLYVSVPFCPSRCRYCSFVSASTEKEGKILPEYISLLCREIEEKARRAERENKPPVTVYVGGGTPTVLEPSLLEILLRQIKVSVLDRFAVREYTFEAGRPDTVTEQKLFLMAKYGVTRISVNPQTLNDEVLRTVGRNHTSEDFYRAFSLAAKYPFVLNTDIIAGLQGDTAESFRGTVDGIIALNPDNVTMHTLYLKRAADIGQTEIGREIAEQSHASQMVAYASEAFAGAGYFPYYLYRQKNTLENLENVGYAKKGKECQYNIYMMDDLQQIYGAGAGAVTKILLPGGVKRECNTKYAYNYVKDLSYGQK